jgi:hypothetical protein
LHQQSPGDRSFADEAERRAVAQVRSQPTIRAGGATLQPVSKRNHVRATAFFNRTPAARRGARACQGGAAAYFYSRDIGRIWRIAEALEYGIVGINEGIISTKSTGEIALRWPSLRIAQSLPVFHSAHGFPGGPGLKFQAASRDERGDKVTHGSTPVLRFSTRVPHGQILHLALDVDSHPGTGSRTGLYRYLGVEPPWMRRSE